MSKLMPHLNDDMFCAVDVETTGLDPKIHDVVQVAIMPLGDDFRPHPKYFPFSTYLKPETPETADPAAMRINGLSVRWLMTNGIDVLRAADMLEEWFENLKLKPRAGGHSHQIVPIGQNYNFDRGFLLKWLGFTTYEYIFSRRYRDAMHAALYMKDRWAWHCETDKLPKVGLQYMCNLLKVSRGKRHDALADAMATAEVYRRLLEMPLPS